MKIFLVRLVKFSTNSYISLHVEAEDHIDASKYAKNQIFGNWTTQYTSECKCPNEKYEEYMGVKIWKIEESEIDRLRVYYLAMFPGDNFAKSMSSNNYHSLKQEIKEKLCIA